MLKPYFKLLIRLVANSSSGWLINSFDEFSMLIGVSEKAGSRLKFSQHSSLTICNWVGATAAMAFVWPSACGNYVSVVIVEMATTGLFWFSACTKITFWSTTTLIGTICGKMAKRVAFEAGNGMLQWLGATKEFIHLTLPMTDACCERYSS